MEGVIVASFAKETCQQSVLPSVLFDLIQLGLRNLLTDYVVSLEGVYTPYSAPGLGQKIYDITDSAMRAAMRCGNQLLITPDSYEDSAARITRGERWVW